MSRSWLTMNQLMSCTKPITTLRNKLKWIMVAAAVFYTSNLSYLVNFIYPSSRYFSLIPAHFFHVTEYFASLWEGIVSSVLKSLSVCPCTHSQANICCAQRRPRNTGRCSRSESVCSDAHVTTNCDERPHLKTKWDQQLWSMIWGELSTPLWLCGVPARCLCCLSISAGCNGLSNGSLLEERVEKWASPPVWHCRSHYTSLVDHRAASHFRAVASCFPRCERGGLVGEGAKQFDSLTLSCWMFAQRNTSKDWQSKSLKHNWITVLEILRVRSSEGTVGSFGKEDCM